MKIIVIDPSLEYLVRHEISSIETLLEKFITALPHDLLPIYRVSAAKGGVSWTKKNTKMKWKPQNLTPTIESLWILMDFYIIKVEIGLGTINAPEIHRFLCLVCMHYVSVICLHADYMSLMYIKTVSG